MIYRQRIREPMAEFIGTAIFIIFGTGVNCQVALSSSKDVASSPKGVSSLFFHTSQVLMVAAGFPLG